MSITIIKSFKEFKQLLLSDDNMQKKFKDNPKGTIMDYEEKEHPLGWDKWIYRLAVGGLIVIILAVIISVVIMYSQSKSENFQVPDLFVAIGSGAIGAVAGLLTPTPTEKQQE